MQRDHQRGSLFGHHCLIPQIMEEEKILHARFGRYQFFGGMVRKKTDKYDKIKPVRHPTVHVYSTGNEWLQFDLGPPTKITGLVTKGQGDKRAFVTSYSLSYSNDSSVWFFYKDVNHFEAKIFGGNMDKNTERRHYLNTPSKRHFSGNSSCQQILINLLKSLPDMYASIPFRGTAR